MTKAKWLLFIPLTLLCIGLAAISLNPEWRAEVRSLVEKPGREVLASAEGDLLNDGSVAKVIKYKTEEGVFVEVFTVNGEENTVVDRILLPDKHDGMFNYQGHVTALAIADIDNDGKRELLAPTFDNQLVPHLNVFRYNPTTRRFELFSSESNP